MKSPSRLFSVAFVCCLCLFASCHKGKGRLILTLELQPGQSTQQDRRETEDILQKRLVNYGVDEDDIVVRDTGERVLIGVSEMSNYPKLRGRIINLLQASARLEFWETYRLRDVLSLTDAFEGGHDTAYHSSSQWNRFLGKFSSLTTRDGRSPRLGYVPLRDTGVVDELLDSALHSGKLPADLRFAWELPSGNQYRGQSGLIFLKAGRDGKAAMVSPAVSEVHVEHDEKTGSASPEISFRFSGSYAETWRRLTKQNIDRSIAIVLDGIVYSVPVVQGEIPNGNCSITGAFDEKEANDLAAVLKSGSLPVPVRIVEVRSVP